MRQYPAYTELWNDGKGGPSIEFLPTYKKHDNYEDQVMDGEYDIGTFAASKGKTIKYRTPSYTDRVLVRNNTPNSLSKTQYKPVSYLNSGSKEVHLGQ